MRTFKHWEEEQYDENQTILEFIGMCLADMRDVYFITNAIKGKCPDIEIPKDITEDELLKLASPIIGV